MMILMTSNSAVSVISECKGNYAKYYYYLILVTGWRWDLVSPAPIWPREEWGLPLPSTLSKPVKEELCRQGGARTLLPLPDAATLTLTLPSWCQEVASFHVQQTKRKEKCVHTTLLVSILSAKEANMPSLSPTLILLVFPLLYSVIPVAFCYYLMLLDFPIIFIS